ATARRGGEDTAAAAGARPARRPTLTGARRSARRARRRRTWNDDDRRLAGRRRRRFADDAAAGDAARCRRCLVRLVRPFDSREAVGLVPRRDQIAAFDRVLARGAGVVELVALAFLLRRAGFPEAGRAVLCGAAGLAIGALLGIGRLGGRGVRVGRVCRRAGIAGGDADRDQAGKRCKV